MTTAVNVAVVVSSRPRCKEQIEIAAVYIIHVCISRWTSYLGINFRYLLQDALTAN